jgi:hypothetical protein
MEKESFTERESLAIIQQMIDTAKREQKNDGISWIVWGWLLFMVSIMSYINLQWQFVGRYFFWNIFSLITILLFIIMYFKRSTKVKTYTGDLYKILNIGFFIMVCFVIVAMNANVIAVVPGFAMLINLYGFWALIYGAVFNFKPSLAGALVAWVLAYAALFVHTLDAVMLLHAGGVLSAYIVPGHWANYTFRKNDTQNRIM